MACGGGGDDNGNSTPLGGIVASRVVRRHPFARRHVFAGCGTKLRRRPLHDELRQVWTQNVAQRVYGDTLNLGRDGGFGVPLTGAAGLGYAQGGARVKLQPGIGHAPAGTPNADYAQATTIPVNDQVSSYLAAHGSFNANQLVLVNGGPTTFS